MTITRIEIYPFYMLNDDEWIGKFIIDLEDKAAQWDLSFERLTFQKSSLQIFVMIFKRKEYMMQRLNAS